MDTKLTVFPTGITIIKFGAEWCGPCKLLEKNLDTFSSMENVHIVKYDIDENLDLATENNIMSVPVLLFYQDGIYMGRTVGAISVKALTEIINGTTLIDK